MVSGASQQKSTLSRRSRYLALDRNSGKPHKWAFLRAHLCEVPHPPAAEAPTLLRVGIVATPLPVDEREGGIMKRRYRPIGATTGEIASVIDHDFYDGRARRLRVQPLIGDMRGFVHRTLVTVTELAARPPSGLVLGPRYA